MQKIVRIHEKILDRLLNIRKKDSELYFVPRKINNKERLDKGYWFLGNDYYLNLSFWNGEDWKEKIHNIGFVVLDNKSSYIELSAQDSSEKARFLGKVVAKIGGFKKSGKKNKWVKHFSGTNYLGHLDNFIFNIKPLIDRLIAIEKPVGIKLLDKIFFNKYCKRIIEAREAQMAFGSMNKLSKICWNTENWNFPSGSKGKSTSAVSYETEAGYGHEEWLFDKSKLIENYHYAFLQPLNIITDKHVNKKYNISLFTINSLNKCYYVGEIKNVECIDSKESKRVYKIYESKGWIKKMSEDVAKVGANYRKFNETPPGIFFNIRFKFSDVFRPEELIEIDETDINITTNRYKLLPKKTEIEFGMDDADDESGGNKKNTNKRRIIFNSEVEYDPYHDQMQNAVYDLLKAPKYGYQKVSIERGRVDIKAKTQQGKWHYFELKTDNPKLSIRKALGQIIEYAYFPNTEKAERLIIIADEMPSEDVLKYLDHIRIKFNLPVSYRYFDIYNNELSDDY